MMGGHPDRPDHPGAMSTISVDLSDLEPEERTCRRCERRARMRFAGLCDDCAAELRATLAGESRDVDATYTPKTNVTPNAVALRDD